MACLIICFIFAGCTHRLNLTELDTNQTLRGVYDTTYKTITVTMPDGEVLEGKYHPASKNQYPGVHTPENAPKTGFGSGVPKGIKADDYALLQSEKTKLLMEVFLYFDSFSEKGYGFARTNDGRRYKISY
jgi:hypothetical protein